MTTPKFGSTASSSASGPTAFRASIVPDALCQIRRRGQCHRRARGPFAVCRLALLHRLRHLPARPAAHSRTRCTSRTGARFVTTPEVNSGSATVRVETTIENNSPSKRQFSLRVGDRRCGGEVVARSRLTGTIAQAAARRWCRNRSRAARSVVDPTRRHFTRSEASVQSGGRPSSRRNRDDVRHPHDPVRPGQGIFPQRQAFEAQGRVPASRRRRRRRRRAGQSAGSAACARLKEIGVNAIRTSHNPPAPELLDFCDRLGLLVKDEAFDEFTPAKNKWVTGRNDGVPSHFGYAENFEPMGGDRPRRTWSGATATIPSSSCGASATRLITRTTRSPIRCSGGLSSAKSAGDKLVTLAKPLIDAVKSLDRRAR